MRRMRRERQGHRLLLCSAAAVLACCAVAACGGAPSGKSTSQPGGHPTATAMPARTQASGELCANVTRVGHLVVTRVNHLPQNHERFSFPATVAVSDAGKVRAAAKALCALPSMPHGAIACPADVGVDYQLTFTAGHAVLPKVTVNPSGCEHVTGVGRVRWLVRSPSFWPVLGAAVGQPHATNSTFRGAMG